MGGRTAGDVPLRKQSPPQLKLVVADDDMLFKSRAHAVVGYLLCGVKHESKTTK